MQKNSINVFHALLGVKAYRHKTRNLFYYIDVFPKDKTNKSGKQYNFELAKIEKNSKYDNCGLLIIDDDLPYMVNGRIYHYDSEQISVLAIDLTLNGKKYYYGVFYDKNGKVSSRKIRTYNADNVLVEYILISGKGYVLYDPDNKKVLCKNTLFLEKEIMKEFRKIKKGFLKMKTLIEELEQNS